MLLNDITFICMADNHLVLSLTKCCYTVFSRKCMPTKNLCVGDIHRTLHRCVQCTIHKSNLEGGLLSSIYTINKCNQHGITSACVYEVNLLSRLAPTGCLLQTIWQVPACLGSPPCTSVDSTLRWSYFVGVAAHQSLFGRRRRSCYHSCTKVTHCHFSVSGCDFKNAHHYHHSTLTPV